MSARHSAFGPLLPASFPPSAFLRSAGQIEYCSSWFNTTLYIPLSSFSSMFIFAFSGFGYLIVTMDGVLLHSATRAQSEE
jgi:hypothetical protein